MQFDAAARISHLERVRDIRAKAARDAQKRRNDLIAALTAARRALSDAKEAAYLVGYRGHDSTKGPILAAQGRVADLEAALDTASCGSMSRHGLAPA